MKDVARSHLGEHHEAEPLGETTEVQVDRVRELLASLDGNRDRAVALLAGLSSDRIDQLGGLG